MEKTKGKHRQWLGHKLDFISPHELSKCVSLFERASGYEGQDWRLEHSSSYELSVEIKSVDDDTCQFHAEWRYKHEFRVFLPYQFVKADGYLKRWDRKSTHVFGQVAFPAIYGVLLIFVCVGFGLLGLTSLGSGDILLGLLVVGFATVTPVLQLRALSDLQQKLADIIVTAVHPMPESLGYRRINLKIGKSRHGHRS